MQPSADLPIASQSFCLPPGFRLLVEVDAQSNIRILIGGAPIATTDAATAAGVPPHEVSQVPKSVLFDEGGSDCGKAASGLAAAKLVAEKRGEDAALKYSEWDALLPRCVVRRELKRALREGRLPCTTKGSKRDGRARMISARDMVRFFNDGENER